MSKDEDNIPSSRMPKTVSISSPSSVTSSLSLPLPLSSSIQFRLKKQSQQIQWTEQKTKNDFMHTTLETSRMIRSRQEFTRQLSTDRNSIRSLNSFKSHKLPSFPKSVGCENIKNKDTIHTPLDTVRAIPIVHWRKISSVPDTERAPDDSIDISHPVNLKKCLTCGKSQVILKLLPCLHSFCQHCLESRVHEHPSRSWFRCELCKKQTLIPSKGIDRFEDNIYFDFSKYSITENDRCAKCNGIIPSCRCTECSQNMCSGCVAEHLREESSKSHYVVNLKQEMLGESSLTAVCEEHSPFTLELFCINCSTAICGRCAIYKHANHISEHIKITAIDRRNELKASLTDSTTKRWMRDARVYLKTCRQEKVNIQADVQKTINGIQVHIQALKDELDELGKGMIKDLIEKEVSMMGTMEKNIEDAEIREKASYLSLETLKQIVDRTRDIELLNKYHNLKTVIAEVKMHSKPPPAKCVRIRYKPFVNSLTSSVGWVQIDACLKRPAHYVELGSLQLSKYISSIYPVDEHKSWIAFRKYIQICNKDGTLGQRLEVGEHVSGLDANSNRTIFVACKTSVKLITSRMNVKFLFQLPHEPGDMKINEKDCFIISFKDAKRVALFDTKGKAILEFDIRNFGFRFGIRINDPWKIAINEKEDIYLTDYASGNIGVFDNQCEIKSAFESNVFRHASLCCDRGLLFIADYKRDSVQVYSQEGQILQMCQTQGVIAPCSIAVDKVGDLWIGSWNGLVKIYSPK